MGIFSWLWRDRRAVDSAIAVIDGAIAKVRSGDELTDDELGAAGASFTALYEALSKRHRSGDNTRFGRDGLVFYENALKLTALGHPDQNAWPLLAGVRRAVAEHVTRAARNRRDPWFHLAAIQPLLLAGDLAGARANLDALVHEPFEYGLAVEWMRASVMAYPSFNKVALTDELLKTIPAPWSESSLPASERWPLLASIFPALATDPRRTLVDARPSSVVRLALDSAWEVRDRTTAEETLSLLTERGYRAQLRACLDDPRQGSSAAQRAFVEKQREALSRHLILAWDLGRAIAVARASLRAGYLDEVDTQAWINELGRRLTLEYPSWDDFGEDYILGARFFDPTQSDGSHASMVRWLMRSPDSPWRTVPFGVAAP